MKKNQKTFTFLSQILFADSWKFKWSEPIFLHLNVFFNFIALPPCVALENLKKISWLPKGLILFFFFRCILDCYTNLLPSHSSFGCQIRRMPPPFSSPLQKFNYDFEYFTRFKFFRIETSQNQYFNFQFHPPPPSHLIFQISLNSQSIYS